MAEAALFVLVQIPFWVDVDPVDNDADMQMISGHIAGSTDFGNGVVFVHRIANLSQKLAAMGIKGAVPAAVVDDQIISMDDAAGKYRLNVSILQPSAPSTDVDAKSSKFITCVASQSTMPSKMPKGVHLLAAIPRRFTDSKCRPGRTA